MSETFDPSALKAFLIVFGSIVAFAFFALRYVSKDCEKALKKDAEEHKH